MNTKLGPYPKYKDSGIPWLGQIPEHWDVRRNGRLFAQRNETGFGELPILEVSLRTGVRVRDMDNLKRKQVMSDAEKYKRAAKGDIAYNMMRMWQGALGTAPVDGLVSPAYVVARPFEETNPYYYSYLFRTEGYKAEVDGYSRGIVKDRNRLYWQDFKRMPSCFPPSDEQSAIVGFLDANAHLVRQYIRNRRRLIEVLKDQKQAIIDKVVTGGLAQNATMKNSGVDWLGEVPEHWQVHRISACVNETKPGIWGEDPKPENQSDHIICVRVADFDMTDLSICESRLTVRAVPTAARLSRLLCPNDLLMEKSGGGDAEPVGRVVANTLTCPAVSSNFVTRIRPNHDLVLPRFLLYVLAHLQACRRNIPSIKQTTGIQNLDERDYFNNYIALPPLDEQCALVAWLDDYSTSIRRAIDQANSEIALIVDYRSRLIADVVAGKLDVTRQQFDTNNEEDELSSLDEFSLEDVDLEEEVDCEDD